MGRGDPDLRPPPRRARAERLKSAPILQVWIYLRAAGAWILFTWPLMILLGEGVSYPAMYLFGGALGFMLITGDDW